MESGMSVLATQILLGQKSIGDIQNYEEAMDVHRTTEGSLRKKALKKAEAFLSNELRVAKTYKEAMGVYRRAWGKLENRALKKAKAFRSTEIKVAKTYAEAMYVFEITEGKLKNKACKKALALAKEYEQAINVFLRVSGAIGRKALKKALVLAKNYDEAMDVYKRARSILLERKALKKAEAFLFDELKAAKTYQEVMNFYQKTGDWTKLEVKTLEKALELATNYEEAMGVCRKARGELKIKALKKANGLMIA